MAFWRRDTHDGLDPVGFPVNIIGVSAYGRFKLFAGHGARPGPVRPVFTARNPGFDLLSRIAHGIAFLLNVSLSLL